MSLDRYLAAIGVSYGPDPPPAPHLILPFNDLASVRDQWCYLSHDGMGGVREFHQRRHEAEEERKLETVRIAYDQEAEPDARAEARSWWDQYRFAGRFWRLP